MINGGGPCSFKNIWIYICSMYFQKRNQMHSKDNQRRQFWVCCHIMLSGNCQTGPYCRHPLLQIMDPPDKYQATWQQNQNCRILFSKWTPVKFLQVVYSVIMLLVALKDWVTAYNIRDYKHESIRFLWSMGFERPVLFQTFPFHTQNGKIIFVENTNTW